MGCNEASQSPSALGDADGGGIREGSVGSQDFSPLLDTKKAIPPLLGVSQVWGEPALPPRTQQ